MEKEKIDYLRWRWKQYNKLDQFLNLNGIIHERFIENNRFYFPQISDALLIDFKNENFAVSQELIEQYDLYQIETNSELIRKGKFVGSLHFSRSNFIENCYFDSKQLSRKELLKKIEQNLVFYLWWDILTLQELILSIANLHFLKSTKRLIGIDMIISFFQEKFKSKEELLEELFHEFQPNKNTIGRMIWDVPVNIFDYGFLFRNELKRCIRIIENECRIANNEKIIGAFYNEDLLFREIARTFGEVHKVVSQGSPDWLTPQRFDIFFPDLNIAIEYQGEQHFIPVDFGGKGMRIAKIQYQENVKRDALKLDKANRNNCLIIYVLPDYDIKKVKKNITSEIRTKIS